MNLLVRRRTVIAARERAKKSKGLGIQHQQRTQQIKLYSRTAPGACLQKQHICWNCLDWHPYKNIEIDNSVVFECVKVLLSKLHAGKLLVKHVLYSHVCMCSHRFYNEKGGYLLNFTKQGFIPFRAWPPKAAAGSKYIDQLLQRVKALTETVQQINVLIKSMNTP